MFGPADRLGRVLETSRWWIWSIALAAPVIVVVYALATVNENLLGDESAAEWVLMGGMLFAWALSAAAGLVISAALILRRRRSRGAEAVLGMLLSGTSALLFAGALLLAYFG